MTLNGVIAIILRYFAEFGRFHGQFHTSGSLAVDLLFFSDKCHSTPTKHDGRAVLFAVAELLVISSIKLFTSLKHLIAHIWLKSRRP